MGGIRSGSIGRRGRMPRFTRRLAWPEFTRRDQGAWARNRAQARQTTGGDRQEAIDIRRYLDGHSGCTRDRNRNRYAGIHKAGSYAISKKYFEKFYALAAQHAVLKTDEHVWPVLKLPIGTPHTGWSISTDWADEPMPKIGTLVGCGTLGGTLTPEEIAKVKADLDHQINALMMGTLMMSAGKKQLFAEPGETKAADLSEPVLVPLGVWSSGGVIPPMAPAQKYETDKLELASVRARIEELRRHEQILLVRIERYEAEHGLFDVAPKPARLITIEE